MPVYNLALLGLSIAVSYQNLLEIINQLSAWVDNCRYRQL